VARTMKVRTMEPIPSSAYPTPARRPLNSRLDTRRLQSAFGLCLPPWQPGVARVLEDLLQPPAWVRA
ncbi:MAG: sugar nucleotide-binding protein, partial [Pseudomonadota bacterium]